MVTTDSINDEMILRVRGASSASALAGQYRMVYMTARRLY